jgi:hypothetical protein
MSRDENPLRLALLMDPLEEGWPSMDLAGEALHEQFHGPLAEEVYVTSLRPRLVPLARRLPVLRERREALNVDRVLTRFLAYPARAALAGCVARGGPHVRAARARAAARPHGCVLP